MLLVLLLALGALRPACASMHHACGGMASHAPMPKHEDGSVQSCIGCASVLPDQPVVTPPAGRTVALLSPGSTPRLTGVLPRQTAPPPRRSA